MLTKSRSLERYHDFTCMYVFVEIFVYMPMCMCVQMYVCTNVCVFMLCVFVCFVYLCFCCPCVCMHVSTCA